MPPIISVRNVYKNIFDVGIIKKWMPDDPAKAGASLALASTISKDAINCFYYTKQSYNNQEIPENRRKFVAANDLSNGFYNVIIPILFREKIKNAAKSTFSGRFGKFFDSNSAKAIYENLKKTMGVNITVKDVEKILSTKSYNAAEAGMSVLFTLFISQVLCKRIVTPLLATPTADHVKDAMVKWEERKAAKNGDTVSFSGKPTEDTNKDQQKESEVKAPNLYVVTSPTFDKFDELITKPQTFQKAEKTAE